MDDRKRDAPEPGAEISESRREFLHTCSLAAPHKVPAPQMKLQRLLSINIENRKALRVDEKVRELGGKTM